MSEHDDNDDLKAKMRDALSKKQAHDSGVSDSGHHKQKGPGERGRQGGSSLFRRKAGG